VESVGITNVRGCTDLLLLFLCSGKSGTVPKAGYIAIHAAYVCFTAEISLLVTLLSESIFLWAGVSLEKLSVLQYTYIAYIWNVYAMEYKFHVCICKRIHIYCIYEERLPRYSMYMKRLNPFYRNHSVTDTIPTQLPQALCQFEQTVK